MLETESKTPLQIGIVGAGVAGLAAAIALRRVGHECEIWERSTFKNENGAAVSIPPNGGRILKRWGFDAQKTQGIQIEQVRRPKGDTLEPMAPTLDFRDIPARYGNEWYFYHRVDMHREFRSMAEDPALEGPAAKINLGCQVIDIEPVEGIVTLKDGRKVQKDLIIVADGQHDRLNKEITGRDTPMQRSGQTAYRCLIPMKDILEDPVTRPLFENEGPGFWAPALPQKGVMCVTYPCRNGEILNCLIVARKLNATHETSEQDQTIEDWNFPATPEMLEAVMDGFHPSVKALMMKSPEIKMYTQMKRDPLPKLFKGKAVLIGDACHPMLLTHAQGVSSSIEDAAALEVFLRGVEGSGDVNAPASRKLTERLAMFEGFRLPRVSATQILTEPIVPGPMFVKMGQAAEKKIRQYYQGPLPPMTSVPHSVPICNFFFAYDVTWEAEQALELANKMLELKIVGQKNIEEGKSAAKVSEAEISTLVTPS
ncbi:hypothetical protein LTS08_007577 [Lithohypha guttulata]|uniref:uncharacterized protein n=1 Tax=Lithohypha guttulata TaxID=1690604 RepID=UPI002DE0F9F6|nr:hypothetical protein LTR51_008372 [Lithohypha guttulata]KAK5096321.1 hypothetical protein LTS08_007577 [Lithohypha guttulata]